MKMFRGERSCTWTSTIVLLLLVKNICADAYFWNSNLSYSSKLDCKDENPFTCNDDSVCYPSSKKCDGKKFCPDGSDENKDDCNKYLCLRHCYEMKNKGHDEGIYYPYACSQNGDAYWNQYHYDCLQRCLGKKGVNLQHAKECILTTNWRAVCIKVADLDFMLFGHTPRCSMFGFRYPTPSHLYCAKLMADDCRKFSSVTDWQNNESDSTSANASETDSKYNANATPFPATVIDLKSNGSDVTSAAETDLKSRGDKNPRPAIFGIAAATSLCVLLQQI